MSIWSDFTIRQLLSDISAKLDTTQQGDAAILAELRHLNTRLVGNDTQAPNVQFSPYELLLSGLRGPVKFNGSTVDMSLFAMLGRELANMDGLPVREILEAVSTDTTNAYNAIVALTGTNDAGFNALGASLATIITTLGPAGASNQQERLETLIDTLATFYASVQGDTAAAVIWRASALDYLECICQGVNPPITYTTPSYDEGVCGLSQAALAFTATPGELVLGGDSTAVIFETDPNAVVYTSSPSWIEPGRNGLRLGEGTDQATFACYAENAPELSGIPGWVFIPLNVADGNYGNRPVVQLNSTLTCQGLTFFRTNAQTGEPILYTGGVNLLGTGPIPAGSARLFGADAGVA